MSKEILQQPYLASKEDFLRYRLRYYQDMRTISDVEVQNEVFPKSFYGNPDLETLLNQRQNAISDIRKSRADFIVVTATKNRVPGLERIYSTLFDQITNKNWLWIVVDNRSIDGSTSYINSLRDDRVIRVDYLEKTGCAYPVRNFGLNLLDCALSYQTEKTPYIFVLDSDDGFYDRYSFHELSKMSRSKSNQLGSVLLHGFSVTENYRQGTVTHRSTEPHDLSSSFPKISKLADIFDKGLNVLSGGFPADCLGWLRYPPEVSFEDNGFNHKLLLAAISQNKKWLAEKYPITIKRLQPESMSASNSKLGNPDLVAQIGEYTVSGLRATMVGYIKYLTDYFQIEKI